MPHLFPHPLPPFYFLVPTPFSHFFCGNEKFISFSHNALLVNLFFFLRAPNMSGILIEVFPALPTFLFTDTLASIMLSRGVLQCSTHASGSLLSGEFMFCCVHMSI
jgi:hypothetical protein